MHPSSLFVILASVQVDYDDHAFGVKPNDSYFALEHDSGWIPATQDNYVVQNIGRAKVQAELWYGDEVQWFGIVHGATIFPGETKVLNNEGKPYYVTGLKLINHENVRAIVHGEGGYLASPFIPDIHFNWTIWLEEALGLASKYVVKNDSLVKIEFKEFLLFFWPENGPDIWHQIVDKINPLLTENAKQTILGIIKHNINIYKQKISDFIQGLAPEKQLYMHIASQLDGLEMEFCFDESFTDYETINFYILPLFSNVVSMNINFYTLGLAYASTIYLDDDDKIQVRIFANNTFHNAVKYIKHISKFGVDYVYNNSAAQNIFNSMMTIRSHLSIHGEEYIPIWAYKVNYPSWLNEVYNPAISFSTFFGKPTANLYAQTTPVEVPQPLCPKLINGKRNVLKKIEIYLWRTNSTILKIGGANLTFENGDVHTLGTVTATIETFDLEDAKILELTAYGDGKIDGLKFNMSNNVIKTFGQVYSNNFKIFKLENHHIPSFYLSSDADGLGAHSLGGQAVNIAVSYQWLVKNKDT